jgi:hypothetical protein
MAAIPVKVLGLDQGNVILLGILQQLTVLNDTMSAIKGDIMDGTQALKHMQDTATKVGDDLAIFVADAKLAVQAFQDLASGGAEMVPAAAVDGIATSLDNALGPIEAASAALKAAAGSVVIATPPSGGNPGGGNPPPPPPPLPTSSLNPPLEPVQPDSSKG